MNCVIVVGFAASIKTFLCCRFTLAAAVVVVVVATAVTVVTAFGIQNTEIMTNRSIDHSTAAAADNIAKKE